jgi:O-antigen/teichoic acid export membrane protein
MNNFLKNVFIYLASNVLNASIPFILIPILTIYLTPSEYGELAIFQSLVVGFSALVGLSVHGAASRKYFDDVGMNTLKEFNGSCLQILLFTFVFFLLVLILFSNQISILLLVRVDWLYLALISTFCLFIVYLRLAQWQVRGMSMKYSLFSLARSILELALTATLIVYLTMGLEGRIQSIIIINIVFSIIALVSLNYSNLISFFIIRKDHIKEALEFGVTLIPHAIGLFLISSFDRLLINKYLGSSASGLYMVAFQISCVFVVLFDAINKAYSPWLFGKLKINNIDINILIVKLSYICIGVMLIGALVLFWLSPYLLELVLPADYKGASEFVNWLILGQVIGGMYIVVVNYIFYAKKTTGLSVITLLSGGLHVILSLMLIEIYGAVGVAIAFCISKSVQFLLTWWWAIKSHTMPWFTLKKDYVPEK